MFLNEKSLNKIRKNATFKRYKILRLPAIEDDEGNLLLLDLKVHQRVT